MSDQQIRRGFRALISCQDPSSLTRQERARAMEIMADETAWRVAFLIRDIQRWDDETGAGVEIVDSRDLHSFTQWASV